MSFERAVLGFDLRADPRSNTGTLSSASREQRFSDRMPDIWITADRGMLGTPDDVADILDEHVGFEVDSLSNPLTLANRFADLVDACHSHGVPTDGLLPLAVTCCKANFVGIGRRFEGEWLHSRPTEEELINDHWRLLGFDVLDLWRQISGLSGCGYTESTRATYKLLFGRSLNEYGLFRSFCAAQRFAEVRGLEIHEHAPFVVVGLLSTGAIAGDHRT